MSGGKYRRIGHKGADALVPGNTLESFEAAAEAGVDMIELDVLRSREGQLVVAHDYHDALTRRPLELTEALDAFLEPPLDEVEIDCDLKLPGREAELAGVLAGHGLLDRAMVSTMEIESLIKLRTLEPELRLGWTYPKTRRDWTSYPWAAPALYAALVVLRRRFPRTLVSRVPELQVDAIWAYHRLVTPRLVSAAERAGVELIAWTVDEVDRVAELAEMGVAGICSNDPRLFDQAAEGAGRSGGDGALSPHGAGEAVEELADDSEPAEEPEPAKDGEPEDDAADGETEEVSASEDGGNSDGAKGAKGGKGPKGGKGGKRGSKQRTKAG